MIYVVFLALYVIITLEIFFNKGKDEKMSKKYVYLFTESDASMRNLLGGKGANLGEMLKLGLPVPEGFTVSTEACTRFYEDGKQISKEIQAEILKALSVLEKRSGKSLEILIILFTFCSFWCESINARHDGHYLKLRFKR